MPKRETKRNAGRSPAHIDFKICKDPILQFAENGPQLHVGDRPGLTHASREPFLFAIARDEHTIFATWNVDWRSVFKKGMPADRQVHLRVTGENGPVKTVAVEPMSATNYLTISSARDSYRVEIGYFQPADTWNSVAESNRVTMPPEGNTEIADADLATIPFHLRFEQLAGLFEAPNDSPLARVVSEFQKRISYKRAAHQLSPPDKQILRKLNLSSPQIAAAQNEFQKSDKIKLTRRTRALLGLNATSPVRGFEASRGS